MRIRNITVGSAPELTVPVVDGGFDPTPGTRLVFGVGYGDGLSGDVFVLDVSLPGAPVRLIGTGNPNTEYAPGPAWPQWSPDGRTAAHRRRVP